MRCEQCDRQLDKEELEMQLTTIAEDQKLKRVCRKCLMERIKTACKHAGFHVGA